jgi:uridine kinase
MYLIGIAGGSGSGKTTFTQKIFKRADDADVAILHQDAYYLPTLPEHLRLKNGGLNFDHPDAFDWTLLREHLTALRAGESVEVPTYDFTESKRRADTLTVGPCKILLVEGIFTLWEQKIRTLFDLKVYLHVDADIRFIRRLHRDVRERGRSLETIIQQYYDTVRPMHHKYLEPTKQYADLIIGEETDLGAEVVASQVKEKLAALQEKV